MSNYQQNIDNICSDLLGKLDSVQITSKTLRDALDKGANRCSCCREQIISVLYHNELLCDMCYKAKRVLGSPAFETVYKDKTWLDKIYDDEPAEAEIKDKE